LLLAGLILLALLCSPSGAAVPSSDPKDLEREIKIGDQVSKEVEERFRLVSDPVVLSRLDAIVARLEKGVLRPMPYRFKVVEERWPNAFALPGGRCYVTTGLLDLLRSDSELAAIMAHEMVHADRAHGIIQAARNQRLSLVSLGIALATRGHGAAMILSNVAQVAIMNQYSKDLEREADLEGLNLMIEAGYDPSGMVTALEKLLDHQIRRPQVDLGVYMSHPELRDRIDYVTRSMEKKGLKVSRRGPLGVLRLSLRRSDDSVELWMDRVKLISAPPSMEPVLRRLSQSLDRTIRFETMPQDVLVSPDGGLWVDGVRVLTSSELPEANLDSLRDALVKSLSEARSRHPLAKIY
jgi:hypothetical protein